MRRLIVAMLTPLVLAGASACAAEYPDRPAGPVLDQAAVIPQAAEHGLDAKLREYSAGTCRAVVVATVSSLEGQSVEDYALRLANHWKIGDPVRGDGILLLVAPTERKVRIEVSRSLQPAMSDAAAMEIIEGGMLARYRSGDFSGGIEQGVEAIIQRLNANLEDYSDCGSVRAEAA